LVVDNHDDCHLSYGNALNAVDRTMVNGTGVICICTGVKNAGSVQFPKNHWLQPVVAVAHFCEKVLFINYNNNKLI